MSSRSRRNQLVLDLTRPEVQAFEMSYLSEALGPPPSPKVIKVVPKDAPQIRRILLRPTPAPAHDDDAYFSFQGFAGESTAAGHSGQTHATTVAVTVNWPVLIVKTGTTVSSLHYGQPTASLHIVKTMGSSTAAFVAAQAQATAKTFSGTIQLVQHSSAGDTVRFTVQATLAWVQSDATQATSGGQTETITLPLQGLGSMTFTDATNGTSGRVK